MSDIGVIYFHYPLYTFKYGHDIGLAQIGKSFRHEKSSERTPMRCWSFNQLELQLTSIID